MYGNTSSPFYRFFRQDEQYSESRELFKFLWKTLKFSSFPPSNVEMSIKKEVIPLFKNYKFLMN